MNKKSKKRFFNKRNKTFKKKSGSSCDHFCKNDYSPEIEKQSKNIANKNIDLATVRDYRIIDCKQKFCNEGCKGYIFLSKDVEKKFKKSINGNFLKKTKPRIIQKLKSKGAISYCDNDDYNPFHK